MKPMLTTSSPTIVRAQTRFRERIFRFDKRGYKGPMSRLLPLLARFPVYAWQGIGVVRTGAPPSGRRSFTRTDTVLGTGAEVPLKSGSPAGGGRRGGPGGRYRP